MSKAEKIKNFNPNDLGDKNANIYGLPFTTDEAEVVIVPVPWEVTVSYAAGTAKGPQAVFDASFQVDLYDPNIKDAWKIGVAMDKIPTNIQKKSNGLRKKAETYIGMLEDGKSADKNSTMRKIQTEVNKECKEMNAWVKQRVLHFMNKNKVVALLGGDHSTPLGMMQALAEKHKSFGILQIDAHADLRDAYEGFEFSHASIMFNALKIKQVEKLVQVGIRDYCEAEAQLVERSKGRIKTFYDRDIKHQQYEGKSWSKVCDDIIKQLPDKIYLSFDIDGLDPKLCPNTGTPVSGGFETEEILFLIQKIVESKKTIIAFDINEIAPGKDEWDANVGARMLYRIANLVAKSNGKVK
ncbi:MAG: agmatinase family protein [Bacteroidetes bacterium]|nr:agmatinase family protein [Bacteroidota bacterium]